ncbi:hypothetical protein ACWGTI_23040 [Mesorhizobium sp. ArgA1]
MKVGDFDTAPLRHTQLFRDAKAAMLTHRVLFHLEMTAASINQVEHALEEFAGAAQAPQSPDVSGWTLTLDRERENLSSPYTRSRLATANMAR